MQGVGTSPAPREPARLVFPEGNFPERLAYRQKNEENSQTRPFVPAEDRGSMRKSRLIKLALVGSLLLTPGCTSNDDDGEDAPPSRGRRRGVIIYPIHTGGGFVRSAPPAPRGTYRVGSVSRGGFGGKFSSVS
jgi:hypothetical protein